eukprot:CAMPEP_0185847906 /NCGR_PEP_ID=MMETSP1354-20130828/2983_1 /TAXON_ID=708628 /ORGANISM="Erythrolobus madagascarensis, Strain CCMP3276" /LENGTH=448 /DNA_ID=CAMNT_0028548241 /DNA_START=9 /DNA_END=1355 /DNA_ORIENTATION=+
MKPGAVGTGGGEAEAAGGRVGGGVNERMMTDDEYFAMRKRKNPRTVYLQKRNRGANFVVVGGLAVCMALVTALPMLLYNRGNQPKKTQEAPLRSHEIRRGAYLNTGSKDVGRDPDWVEGVYRRKPRAAAAAASSSTSASAGADHDDDIKKWVQIKQDIAYSSVSCALRRYNSSVAVRRTARAVTRATWSCCRRDVEDVFPPPETTGADRNRRSVLIRRIARCCCCCCGFVIVNAPAAASSSAQCSLLLRSATAVEAGDGLWSNVTRRDGVSAPLPAAVLFAVASIANRMCLGRFARYFDRRMDSKSLLEILLIRALFRGAESRPATMEALRSPALPTASARARATPEPPRLAALAARHKTPRISRFPRAASKQQSVLSENLPSSHLEPHLVSLATELRSTAVVIVLVPAHVLVGRHDTQTFTFPESIFARRSLIGYISPSFVTLRNIF